MLYIRSGSTSPYRNLAAEEYFLKNKTEDIFMLWRNEASVIIGRNQNALSEIDIDYVTREKIPVVRRMSGGGAVFHDLENLNFTYIENGGAAGNYEGFTTKLRACMSDLGVETTLSGRNDLLADGRKFSGLAQYKWHDRLLSHGCILINADLSRLSRALKPDMAKIESKGIKSVRSRVVNVSELVDITCLEFMQRFENEIKKDGSVQNYIPSDADNKAIDSLCREKYMTYEWNFGYSPKYTYHAKKRFEGGGVEVFLLVENGVIKDASVFGDFLSPGGIDGVLSALKGAKHEKNALMERLAPVFEKDVFLMITKEQFLSCLI